MLSSDLGFGKVFGGIRLLLGLFYWVHQSLQKRLMFVGGDFLYSLERESVMRLLLGSAHLLQEGLKGMKPSSSAGSQSSFIRFLASSLVSFSPRFTSSLNSSNSRMVSSAFLSYSFRISTKSWKPPWSLESLQALYMGKTSGLVRNFSPLATPPPISLMVFRVGFRLQARTRSPT